MPCVLVSLSTHTPFRLHLRQLVWVDSAPDVVNPHVTHVLLAAIHSGVDAPMEQLVRLTPTSAHVQGRTSGGGAFHAR
jgi:hypothetical protein